MSEEDAHMDINEMLRNLTPEQSKALSKGLGNHLNSVYAKAEADHKKKATAAKKKPSTKKGKK